MATTPETAGVSLFLHFCINPEGFPGWSANQRAAFCRWLSRLITTNWRWMNLQHMVDHRRVACVHHLWWLFLRYITFSWQAGFLQRDFILSISSRRRCFTAEVGYLFSFLQPCLFLCALGENLRHARLPWTQFTQTRRENYLLLPAGVKTSPAINTQSDRSFKWREMEQDA